MGYPRSGIACLFVVGLNPIAKGASDILYGRASRVAQDSQAQCVPSGAGAAQPLAQGLG